MRRSCFFLPCPFVLVHCLMLHFLSLLFVSSLAPRCPDYLRCLTCPLLPSYLKSSVLIVCRVFPCLSPCLHLSRSFYPVLDSLPLCGLLLRNLNIINCTCASCGEHLYTHLCFLPRHLANPDRDAFRFRKDPDFGTKTTRLGLRFNKYSM